MSGEDTKKPRNRVRSRYNAMGSRVTYTKVNGIITVRVPAANSIGDTIVWSGRWGREPEAGCSQVIYICAQYSIKNHHLFAQRARVL